MICYDTNYIVLIVNSGKWNELRHESIISRISYIEFLSYKSLSTDTLQLHKDFLNNYFKVIEINEDISDLSAYLRRKEPALRLPDSVILATTRVYDAELKTLDKQLERYYEKLA